jgi:hypothetical protein
MVSRISKTHAVVYVDIKLTPIIWIPMKKSLLAMSLLTFTIIGGGFSLEAFARPNNGNTINHTNVTNTLNSNSPNTTNRTSSGVVRDAGHINVGNDTNIILTGSCDRSTGTNTVNQQGTTGSSQDVVVDACNPAAGGSGARRNR